MTQYIYVNMAITIIFIGSYGGIYVREARMLLEDDSTETNNVSTFIAIPGYKQNKNWTSNFHC